MGAPADGRLYDAVKQRVYKEIPKHSAYRSGLLVQEYKRAFATRYGEEKDPYTGPKPKNLGLTRWFAEEWRNEAGGVGYDSKNTLYRPTKRVSAATPKTWAELPKSRVKSARAEKKRTGRVQEF